MELFEHVFNKTAIYESFFFNVKSVAGYKTVMELKKNDPELFKQWELIAKTKYGAEQSSNDEQYMLALNDTYKAKAAFYPEFSKIVAITYATVESSDGKLVRHFKKIVDKDEFEVVKGFQRVLLQLSSDGVNSTPQFFPTLCGHNIINNDIPLFIKRLLYYRDKFEEKTDLLPFIIKKYLQAKPWDANIVDTINLWKFNGISSTPLSSISDFMGLKRNVEIYSIDDLSQYYWDNIEENENDTLEFVALQSANQTNLVIQIMNELRSL